MYHDWEMIDKEEITILKRKLNKQDGSLWIGFIFGRISTSGRLL